MESVLTFVQRYHDDGDEFLDRIITGDETWVAVINAMASRQSVLRLEKMAQGINSIVDRYMS